MLKQNRFFVNLKDLKRGVEYSVMVLSCTVQPFGWRLEIYKENISRRVEYEPSDSKDEPSKNELDVLKI